jgi:hypothetical protein
MKHIVFCLILIVLVVGSSNAQLTITGTTPMNNATNVAGSTTISITFSAPLDTTILANTRRGIFTSIDTIKGMSLSPDKRTLNYTVGLAAGKAHYLVFYYVKAASGAPLTTPYIFYFTRDASFPATSVSGTVYAGGSGIEPSGSMVILTDKMVGGDSGEPNLIMGTISTSGGAFTIPYVKNGGYYPLATKDLNQDGQINPDQGADPLAIGDSITVTGSNVTGVALALATVEPMTFRQACDSAMVIALTLPVDRSLRQVSGYEVDTLGRSSDWSFHYIIPSDPAGRSIKLGGMKNRIDTLESWMRQTVSQARQISNLAQAADATTFITNCENAGGKAFRTHPGDTLEFHNYVNLGDLRWTEFWNLVTDTSKNYWGASYWWGTTTDSSWNQKRVMKFLGDFQTGVILRSTDVRPIDGMLLPERMTLAPNYPNPFNPSTTLSFSIPGTQEVSLRVFNILGEHVATLADGIYAHGVYSVRFSADDMPSGVYLTVLRSGGSVLVQKMMLMR